MRHLAVGLRAEISVCSTLREMPSLVCNVLLHLIFSDKVV